MSADLHLHVASPAAASRLDDLRLALGSEVRVLWGLVDEREAAGATGMDLWPGETFAEFDAAQNRAQALSEELDVYCTESVWLGQVSWAKAGPGADWRRWVPRSVERISSLFEPEQVRVLTPGLATAIVCAFSLPHDSHFERTVFAERSTGMRGGGVRRTKTPGIVKYTTRGVAKARTVKRWCAEHLGEHVYLQSE